MEEFVRMNLASEKRQKLDHSTNSARHVRSVEISNPMLKIPSLQNLPTEIILHVVSYLPTYAKVCVGYTCGRFRQILITQNVQYKPLYIEKEDIRTAKVLLRSLAFCRDCNAFQAEHCSFEDPLRPKLLQNRFHNRTLFCSGCQRGHSILLFSDTEQQKSSDERVCIGRQGRIRLCQHQQLTYETLSSDRFLIEPENNRYAVYVKCYSEPSNCKVHEQSDGIIVAKGGAVSERKRPSLIVGLCGGCWICAADNGAADSVLRKGILHQALNLDHMCPHILGSSERYRHILERIACIGEPQCLEGCDGAQKHVLEWRHKDLCQDCNSNHGYGIIGSGSDKTTLPYLSYRREFWVMTFHGVTISTDSVKVKSFIPWSFDWLMHLDHNSYQLPRVSKHLLWCDDESCHTNHHFTHDFLDSNGRLYTESKEFPST